MGACWIDKGAQSWTEDACRGEPLTRASQWPLIAVHTFMTVLLLHLWRCATAMGVRTGAPLKNRQPDRATVLWAETADRIIAERTAS